MLSALHLMLASKTSVFLLLVPCLLMLVISFMQMQHCIVSTLSETYVSLSNQVHWINSNFSSIFVCRRTLHFTDSKLFVGLFSYFLSKTIVIFPWNTPKIFFLPLEFSWTTLNVSQKTILSSLNNPWNFLETHLRFPSFTLWTFLNTLKIHLKLHWNTLQSFLPTLIIGYTSIQLEAELHSIFHETIDQVD